MKIWIPLFAAALLGGCASVGPDFKAPVAPAVKSYVAGDELVSHARHVALGKRITSEWWALFASKPLDDLVRRAVTDNYALGAARQTLAQAQEAVRAEHGGLMPQVSLAAAAGRQKYGVAQFGPADFSIPPFTYYEAGPAVSWTPDLFGGQRRRIERQRALAAYQAHQLDAAYVSLTGRVVAEAIELTSAKAEIEAVQRIVAEDTKTLKLVRHAYADGAATRSDKLTARSQLQSDRARLPPLEQRLSVARHALAILLGKAPAQWTPPNFDLDAFALPRALPVSLPSELVHRRPDILAAEADLHAASASVGVATADLYPRITLSADMLQEALTPAGLFKAAGRAWSLAANLSAPLFNGGTLTARKRAAVHAYQAALARYRQTILVAFGQVADALTALAHDNEAVGTLKDGVGIAEDSLEVARKSYQAGSVGLLQVEDAERQLARAQLGLVRARSRRYADTARLFVTLGGSPDIRSSHR